MKKMSNLTTETRNSRSMRIDTMDTMNILLTINEDDTTVAHQVKKVIHNIAQAVDMICQSLNNGGRLFYIGAGTSGRLGILDAVECPPTYSTDPKMVQGVLAGGVQAIFKAVEGVEDNEQQGAQDLIERNFNPSDIVVGIAASGRTPYVIGALKYAKSIGANAVSLASNQGSEISTYADVSIEVITGPEIITGSTRMKAATAQKLILNMITTASMIKSGRVFENLMVDVQINNYKLLERAKNIICTVSGISYLEAERVLTLSNNQVKPAIVMAVTGVSYEEAYEKLNKSEGFVRRAITLILEGGHE